MTTLDRVRPERPMQPAPLTDDEIAQVVDLVVAYTRREPDRTMVQVWAAQSVIGRWTCTEAEQAIHLWAAHREPGAFLEPDTVTRAIRADRQDRALRAEAARLREPADAAAAERIREIVSGIAERRSVPSDQPSGGDEKPGADDPRGAGPVLSVACPHCGADVGEHCTTGAPRYRRLGGAGCHPSRAAALAEPGSP